MTYRLRPGLSYCQPDGRTIFLDLEADRYFELKPPLAQALTRLASGGSGPIDVGLIDRDLIRPGDAAGPPIAPFAWPPAEHSGLERDARTRPRPWDYILVALAMGMSMTRLRALKLRRTLERLALRRRRLAAEFDGAVIDALADRFLAARRLLPLPPVCLRDSLALLDFLALHGCAADLVFGVEAAPFSAHCWVQSGQCALNETLHQARRHTPILAI